MTSSERVFIFTLVVLHSLHVPAVAIDDKAVAIEDSAAPIRARATGKSMFRAFDVPPARDSMFRPGKSVLMRRVARNKRQDMTDQVQGSWRKGDWSESVQALNKNTGPEVVPIDEICDSFHLDSVACSRVRTYVGKTLRDLKAPLRIKHPVSTHFQHLRGDTTTATALKDPAMPGAPPYQRGVAKDFGKALDNVTRFVDGPQPCMVAADDEAWLKAWRYPTIVKAGPVHETSGNHVIARVRLGRYESCEGRMKELSKSDIPFAEKTDTLVWRGVATGENGKCGNGQYVNRSRRLLVSKYLSSPDSHIDVGYDFNDGVPTPAGMIKDKKDLSALLKNKYIMVVEGNDVASSTVWVLASNSVPLMTPPVVQTWHLHGWLEPWKHFIPVEPDFSDLQTKLQWAMANPSRAEEIANGGKEFLKEFQDREREERINSAVLVAYFNRFRIERSGEKGSTIGQEFPQLGSSRCLLGL